MKSVLGLYRGQSGKIVCVNATDNLLRLQNVKLGASGQQSSLLWQETSHEHRLLSESR